MELVLRIAQLEEDDSRRGVTARRLTAEEKVRKITCLVLSTPPYMCNRNVPETALAAYCCVYTPRTKESRTYGRRGHTAHSLGRRAVARPPCFLSIWSDFPLVVVCLVVTPPLARSALVSPLTLRSVIIVVLQLLLSPVSFCFVSFRFDSMPNGVCRRPRRPGMLGTAGASGQQSQRVQAVRAWISVLFRGQAIRLACPACKRGVGIDAGVSMQCISCPGVAACPAGTGGRG